MLTFSEKRSNMKTQITEIREIHKYNNAKIYFALKFKDKKIRVVVILIIADFRNDYKIF